MANAFDRLMTTIKPYLPGAIDEAIRQELFVTCLQFFRDSDTWQEPMEFALEAGEQSYELYPYSGKIVRLLAATDPDGVGIRGATMPEIPIIVLPFATNKAGNYTALVSLTVTDPLTRDAYPIVPFDLVERYNDELMYGILSRMMAQPSKPYTNLSMAQYYTTKYKGGMNRARNAKATGNVAGSQRWAFPQQFSSPKIRR